MKSVTKKRFLVFSVVVVMLISVFGSIISANDPESADYSAKLEEAYKEADGVVEAALTKINEAYGPVKTVLDKIDEANAELSVATEAEDDAKIAEIEDQIEQLSAELDEATAVYDPIVDEAIADVEAWVDGVSEELPEVGEDEDGRFTVLDVNNALDGVKNSVSYYLGVYAEAKVNPDDAAAADAVIAAQENLDASLGDLSDLIADVTSEFVEDGKFYATFWALVPPIIAIGLALITKEVYSSLFIGILSGALLAANFKPLDTMDVIINDGLIGSVSGNAGIFIFLVILGIFVALINKTGAAAAFGKWAQKNIKTRVGAQLATFVLGILIFIDDYFNCLTVGSVMKPVTDSHKVSRAKLSYLIDATAAPVCMIAPISSWAAAVSEYAEGTEMGGFELFIKAIPFNYYSLATLLFVFLIIVMKVDFGPMAKHERNAIEKGDLFTTGVSTNKAKEEIEVNEKGRVYDLVFPVVLLIAICIFALVYVGGILDGTDFITAFGDTDATVGLPWGALIALVVTIIYLCFRRVITFKDAMDCVPKGFVAMVPAILILTFATSLKGVTDLLGAKAYIEELMMGAADGLDLFLPAVIFIVACGLAFATGTSWGTFGILIPIVTAMFEVSNPLYIIGMSACLAGAVCGDHCSPISDTTIMSSAGAECDHINHVSTQIPYAVTVAAVSFVSYIVGGLTGNGWIGLAVALALTAGVVIFAKARQKKQ